MSKPRKKAKASRSKTAKSQPEPLATDAGNFDRVHRQMEDALTVCADIAMGARTKADAERYAQCFLAGAVAMMNHAKQVATPFRIPLRVYGQTLRYPQDLDHNPHAEYRYSRDNDDRESRPQMSDEDFRDATDETVGAVPTFMGHEYWDSSQMCTGNAPWFDGDDFYRQTRMSASSKDGEND